MPPGTSFRTPGYRPNPANRHPNGGEGAFWKSLFLQPPCRWRRLENSRKNALPGVRRCFLGAQNHSEINTELPKPLFKITRTTQEPLIVGASYSKRKVLRTVLLAVCPKSMRNYSFRSREVRKPRGFRTCNVPPLSSHGESGQSFVDRTPGRLTPGAAKLFFSCRRVFCSGVLSAIS